MTKTISRLFAALLLIGISVSSQAQTLIDYGVPAKLFQVGVRAGFNTSNLTTNYDDAFQDIKWNHNQWKGGFSAGMVVDINLRNFFTIQPGIFLDTRKSTYHYLVNSDNVLKAIDGQLTGNYIRIPILASLRLGVAELAQVQIDFGPYFAWGFGGANKYTVYGTSDTEPTAPQVIGRDFKSDCFGDKGMVQTYDWGLKMGLGVLVMQH
ncbi:porin family protein, partial [uncultured Muribaculum sp.]